MSEVRGPVLAFVLCVAAAIAFAAWIDNVLDRAVEDQRSAPLATPAPRTTLIPPYSSSPRP